MLRAQTELALEERSDEGLRMTQGAYGYKK